MKLRSFLQAALFQAALLVLLAPGAVSGQGDVEMLGLQHGTRPPDAYYELLAQDPQAYQFNRAWMRRAQALRPGPAVPGQAGGPAAVLGDRGGIVQGTFQFPLVLGLFSDSPGPPHVLGEVQQEFFDGPNSRAGTITDFYREVSGGLVELVGETFDWERVSLTQAEVAGGVSGLGGGNRVWQYIFEILAALDQTGIDWGRYDNDGPDGVPNSGDDDGFVDVLAVMHPLNGAECGLGRNSDHIWSHRWRLSAPGPSAFMTVAPAANGGFIKIDDYTIQPVKDCNASDINRIGVFAHELGHGFGLPDLYNTQNTSIPGAGNWDLMATGAWGCDSSSAELPCHMGAWSKSVLGWVQVVQLDPGVDHDVLILEPVQESGKVYQIGDGATDYFLLENRQKSGFDLSLREAGLLVWHIDPQVLSLRWPGNSVNADPNRMGVWLRQADGSDDLVRVGGGRGDDGDPFPGSTGNTEFHAGSNPSSWTHTEGPSGLTILDIQQSGENMEMRLLTRFQTITVRSDDVDDLTGLVLVDGLPPETRAGEGSSSGDEVELTFSSAPFQSHEIEAAAGIEITDGVRTGFESWEDGSDRVRSYRTLLSDSTLVAGYETPEVRFRIDLESPVEGIEPGSVAADVQSGDFVTPEDFWFTQGSSVMLTAIARTGFSFREWLGALAGETNPVTVIADAPIDASASFDQSFGVIEGATTLEVEAATDYQITFEVENANEPVAWTLAGGTLPAGLLFRSTGTLLGSAGEVGGFPLALKARDGIGLESTVAIQLDVREPRIGIAELVGPFLLGDAQPTNLQRVFLDDSGNADGLYDLGDLRAFLIRNPDLPMSSHEQGLVSKLITIGKPVQGGGRP